MATLYPMHLKHEWQPIKRARAKRKKIKKNNAYNKEFYRVYRAFFHRKYEGDVIEWLEANQPYKQAILKAVRHEIEREASEREKD